ncbi:hypothetical protein PQO03_00210 [Lentisphaera profundi]|uniref:Cytochrome C Planctomycete-type domain-containing protein n=1 Tax=Lentisphaera profundi TaxID=1658616 RepID=A0ABY7VQC9_9BACT|nr:c-type cytochrome domain-containing protein [Lentisphaera profundi]WDE96390.1 hypothetical protein PQO03_00210 [Lentisphaera profundi]
MRNNKLFICISSLFLSFTAFASDAVAAGADPEAQQTLFMKMIRAITFTSDGNIPDFFIFLGRHHPLILHLPVGLLAVIAFLEIFSWWRKVEIYDEAMYILCWIAAVTSVGAAGLGILLALPGGYNPELLSRHGWLGLAVAVAAILALYLKHHYRKDKIMAKRHRFRGAIFIACVLMGFAGHDGGSLTHGTEYLFEYAPDPLRQMTGRSKKTVKEKETKIKKLPYFEAKVLPIFEKHCVSCHGEEKMKGKLKLNNILGIMRRYDKIIAPGHAMDSELYALLVTEDTEEIMPPEGNSILTKEEKAIIHDWIDGGASFSDIELKPMAKPAPTEVKMEKVEVNSETVKAIVDLSKLSVEQRFVHEKILPFFEAKCTKCHGEKKDKGDLRLHTIEMIKASFEEEVIIPGNPEDSWLYDSLITDDEDSLMPPPKEKNPVTKEEIAMIKEWIKNGAKGLE